MCRQAWFPPDAARDVKSLVTFLLKLENSAGGDGNGAGWVDVTKPERCPRVIKGTTVSVVDAARLLIRRPAGAWGIFHTRLTSVGLKDSMGCHPHSETRNGRTVLLTHNGTWAELRSDTYAYLLKIYPNDSAALAGFIAHNGWSKVVDWANQTICAAIREEGKWTLRAWRNTLPLVLLKNGTVASENGDGEYDLKGWLKSGDHDLTKPEFHPAGTSTSYSYGSGKSVPTTVCSSRHDDDLSPYSQYDTSDEYWRRGSGWTKPGLRRTIRDAVTGKSYASMEEFVKDQQTAQDQQEDAQPESPDSVRV